MKLLDLVAGLTDFGGLLRRSMASSLFLGVMLSGIAIGYAARPLADLLRDHPKDFISLFDIDQNNASRVPPGPAKVNWPDPNTIKILTVSTADLKNALVPGLGQPKTVKTYRISPNGTIIDGAPSAAGSSPF